MPTLSGTIDSFVAGNDLNIVRTITNISTSDVLAKAWFTVKKNKADADASAIFQKEITVASLPGTGQITDTGVTDGIGSVTFELTDVNTLLLEGGRPYYYDIKVKTAAGLIYTPEVGQITPTAGVTVDIT